MESCRCAQVKAAAAAAVQAFEWFPPGAVGAHERTLFWAVVAVSWLATFVRQNGRRNYSVVDRLWPLLPTGLVAQWAYDSGLAGRSKAAAAAGLVAVWSVRLCYNSVRRGDYRWGAEDYRWAHVRQRLGGCWAVWEAFNLLFIALAQLAVVYLLAAPVRELIWHAGPGAGCEWTASEMALLGAMTLLLVGEAVADQQQYDFQMRKRRGEPGAGFVHSGLWRYSRHPNVACELAFWTAMALYCALATGADLRRADGLRLLAGPALLALVVHASVRLTEQISRSRYPLYRAYQLRTSRLLPMTPLTSAQVIATAHRRHQQ
ncbi:hypothetical protein H4R19_005025 [Coemansia spiralis]|nr:hypothetical protein H4R19_005025 [Coemansia spiralis]